MALFCDDRDLLVWESEIFSEPGVAHLALLSNVDVNVAGTAVTSGTLALSQVEPGMVAVLTEGAGDPPKKTSAVITAVASADSASVSIPRAEGEAAAPPRIQGDVKLSVVSFRPLIEAVGDEIKALLGIAADHPVETAGLLGLKPAVVFGTLAAIYRAIGPSVNADKKLALYTRLYQIARRAVAGVLDLDGDGNAETHVNAGITSLERK